MPVDPKLLAAILQNANGGQQAPPGLVQPNYPTGLASLAQALGAQGQGAQGQGGVQNFPQPSFMTQNMDPTLARQIQQAIQGQQF